MKKLDAFVDMIKNFGMRGKDSTSQDTYYDLHYYQ